MRRKALAPDSLPGDKGGVIGRLLFREARHTGWLYFKVFMAVLEKGLGISFAFALRVMIDATIRRSMDDFLSWALVLLLLMALQVPAAMAGRYASGRYMALAMRDMRIRSNRKMAELPLSLLNAHHSGDLIGRATTDLGQIAVFLENHFADSVMMLVTGAVSLAVMLYWSWQVTAATFAVTPLFMWLAVRAGRPIEPLTEQRNRALGEVSAAAQDAVGGAAEVKSYGLYGRMAARHDAAADSAVGTAVRIARVGVRVELANLLTILVSVIMVLAVGVWMVLLGRISIGVLMALILLSNNVRMPLQTWNQMIAWWKGAAGAARRVFALWDWPSEREDGENLPIDPGAPLVSFQSVRFSYLREEPGGGTVRRVVFSGLTLDIRKGESVAVVGPSGCGKSTLLHLIAGFYEAESGEIRFGGHRVARWRLPALRRHMALVGQDTYLFPGSLRDNIACGAEGRAGAEAVERAARQACIHEFIASLPDGYDTLSGERGVRLSGGQRQRVAIARALLKDAQLLLLDEPTSALDMETEKEIQRELRDLRRGRTSVIVAHRLSAIRDADRIVVIDKGRIVEEGDHDRLMAADGVYADLVREQMRLEGGEPGAD